MDDAKHLQDITELNAVLDDLCQANRKISYTAIGDVYEVSRQAICSRRYLRPLIEEKKLLQYLDRATKLARHYGGTLLTQHFKTCNTKMKWKCSDSSHHPFFKSYNQVYHNCTWCPECAKATRNLHKATRTLQNGQSYAESRGGHLVSTEVGDIYEQLVWKCSNPEHPSFKSSYNNLVNYKRWCRKCPKEN